MQTLTSRIEAVADLGGTITFKDGDRGETISWVELHDDARAMAAAMQARGIEPGMHVGLLGPTTRPLVTGISATWLAGATLMMLPLPMRLASIEDFVEQTRVRLRKGDVDLLIIDEQLAEFVQPEPGDPPMVRLDEIAREARRLGPGKLDRPADDPERPAIMQFTSGSTSEPKGVVLPHRAVCANIDGMIDSAGWDIDVDVMVSWLPLYHDMGLVGMHTIPITTGASLVIGAPQDFLAKPSRWMQWLSDHKGTTTAGPNFSWVLATRALRRMEGLDLSPCRLLLNGAEPVDPTAVRAFVEQGQRFGMRAGAVFPAFGMAEVSIAATFPPILRGLATDPVDRRVLEAERYARPADPKTEGTRELVKLGAPLLGMEMRIADPDTGHVLGDREVGELELKGTSMMVGYYNNPDATAASMRGDWLRTGDLAYTVDGELIVCGRIKDVIILGGRNVFPDDIERAVAGIEGVRAGNIIAFGVENAKRKETIVIVAEVKGDDLELIRKHMHHRAMEVTGVPPHDIVLVRPGTLPKTSSGKLQRGLCKQRYISATLELADSLAG
ncbi:MAG: AMP-binding protein [Actinobacteria bacterium]|nr:AMP-binding protein [Actinomycetota bacterium]